MIQTCKHCGAINPSSVETCGFCAARLNLAAESSGSSIPERAIGASVGAASRVTTATDSNAATVSPSNSASESGANGNVALESDWRGELSERIKSYRARRKRSNNGDSDSQNALPFDRELDGPLEESPQTPTLLDEDQYEDPLQATLAAAATRLEMGLVSEDDAVPADEVVPADEIVAADDITSAESAAMNESASRHHDVFQPLLIDVSGPLEAESAHEKEFFTYGAARNESLIVPVAEINLRRRAGIIDAVCVLLSCAAVFGMFAAVGGQLAATKADALVLGSIVGLLYALYFTLFTMMGGATPGMMLAGLRLVNYDGYAPEPRQLMWRSFGYIVSGATAFLGFLWTLFDEDHLSWHDRISQTYITSAENLGEAASTHTAT